MINAEFNKLQSEVSSKYVLFQEMFHKRMEENLSNNPNYDIIRDMELLQKKSPEGIAYLSAKEKLRKYEQLNRF